MPPQGGLVTLELQMERRAYSRKNTTKKNPVEPPSLSDVDITDLIFDTEIAYYGKFTFYGGPPIGTIQKQCSEYDLADSLLHPYRLPAER